MPIGHKYPDRLDHRRLGLQLQREAARRLPDIAYKDIYMKILEGGYSRGSSHFDSGNSPGLKLKGVDTSAVELREQGSPAARPHQYGTEEKRLQGQDDWAGEGDQHKSMIETGKSSMLPRIGSLYGSGSEY